MHPHRKLLVLGLNHLVSEGLVSLAPKDGEKGYVLTTIAGCPSLINWSDVGFNELRIAVWWDYDKARDPHWGSHGDTLPTSPIVKRSKLPTVVGAVSAAWLERKTGVHFQGSGQQQIISKYLRSDARAILGALPDPVPNGFAPEGKFFF